MGRGGGESVEEDKSAQKTLWVRVVSVNLTLCCQELMNEAEKKQIEMKERRRMPFLHQPRDIMSNNKCEVDDRAVMNSLPLFFDKVTGLYANEWEASFRNNHTYTPTPTHNNCTLFNSFTHSTHSELESI